MLTKDVWVWRSLRVIRPIGWLSPKSRLNVCMDVTVILVMRKASGVLVKVDVKNED